MFNLTKKEEVSKPIWVSKLCSNLAWLIDNKCIGKLTWYNFVVVILNSEFRKHPGVLSMEAEVDCIQLDVHGMFA